MTPRGGNTKGTELRTLDEVLFDLAPDGIVLVDETGVIVRVNQRMLGLFGYSRDELVGQSIEMLVPDAMRGGHHRHRAEYAAAPHTRPMGEGLELAGRCKDGSELPIEIALAPVPIRDGRGVLAVVRDVSARRLADHALREARDELERRVVERTQELSDANHRLIEEQGKLIRAEKLSSIGLLAAGVAHDIKDPLSGVMGLIKALGDGAVPESRRGEYFDTVNEGLERIKITVQGLLDFARLRPPSKSVFAADDMIAACLRLVMPATRKKTLEVQHITGADEAGPLRVRADRSQLMQAMVNVLMNAIYAAPEGSEITVTTTRVDDRVAMRIADRGPGIPPAVLARICDPFFTTKPEGEGTGLGLAITIGILQGHGGDLTVESTERGTTISLWVPVPSEEATDA